MQQKSIAGDRLTGKARGASHGTGCRHNGDGRWNERSVCTSSVKAFRESMEYSIFLSFGAGLLSPTGQGDREADASKRWFIQYNSGRASNIGDITEKALEAGCAVSQYVNLRSLRR